MRACTIIEHLRRDHTVVVLTFGQALEMLAPIYAETDVEVRDIGGMYLEYNRWGRMSPTKTLLWGLPYAFRIPAMVRQLRDELKARRAELVITDFEPVSLRAALRAGVPVLSIDHQRFLETCDLGDLPWLQRFKVWCMNFVIRRVFGMPDRMIVSGFHLPKLKPEYRHAHAAGVLLRDEVLSAPVQHGSHLVVYLRRNCPEHVLAVLEAVERPVHIYGLGELPPRGQVEFRKVSPDEFVADLAQSDALITTAGNQLIGEALFMKKPVLAFPEPGNFEQQINGHMLNVSGGGLAISHAEFTLELLRTFLNDVGMYRARIKPEAVCGNQTVFALLDRQLAQGTRKKPPRRRTKAAPVRSTPRSLARV
jgi:uncharacterized protein (TIGR00661 family)